MLYPLGAISSDVLIGLGDWEGVITLLPVPSPVNYKLGYSLHEGTLFC